MTQPLFSQILQTYDSGQNTTWIVPAGVTYIKVEAWGGGGRGGSRTSNGVGGGGGGGAYASSILIVNPGETYYVQVGIGSSNNSNPGGDSWFSTVSNSSTDALVLAKGGSSVTDNNPIGANGGSYAQSVGDIRFNGGRGSDGLGGSWGGGGGSSAGAAGLGVNATNQWGAVGPSGHDGIGGNGQASGGNGSVGLAPGGGGGGARRNSNTNRLGGNGANGRVIITDLSTSSYDLSIRNTVDNNTPVIRSNVTFTIQVTNNASLLAQGIKVLDQLPSGFTYSSHNAPTGTTYSQTTGVWDIGDLPAGQSISLTITATVNPTGSYANVATLSADKENRSRSSSNITLFPKEPAVNLQLTKEVDSAMMLMGGEVIFTLTAHNAGPQNATGVKVEDLLPSGLAHKSNSGGYVVGTGIWDIGNLSSGETRILTITAEVNTSGEYLNQASISGNEMDPDLRNNVSEVEVYPMYPLIEIVLPAGTNSYDLTNVDIASPPVGTEVSWHTGSPATFENKISTPSSVSVGETYYVAFYDPNENCYSATSELRVIRSVLITNPMIRQRVKN